MKVLDQILRSTNLYLTPLRSNHRRHSFPLRLQSVGVWFEPWQRSVKHIFIIGLSDVTCTIEMFVRSPRHLDPLQVRALKCKSLSFHPLTIPHKNQDRRCAVALTGLLGHPLCDANSQTQCVEERRRSNLREERPLSCLFCLHVTVLARCRPLNNKKMAVAVCREVGHG